MISALVRAAFSVGGKLSSADVSPSRKLGRNYLKGRDGDCINAVLAAVGYNFGLLLRWLDS